MDPAGVFVNVGRAEVVEREAVVRILRERPSFVFASDVWWGRNDFAKDADVMAMPNVVATPWAAGLQERGGLAQNVGGGRREPLEAGPEEAPRNIARREDYIYK